MAAMATATGKETLSVSRAPSTAPARCAVIGCGSRGSGYARYALDHPEAMQIVAIAEPRDIAIAHMRKQHDIPDDAVYRHWVDLLKPEVLEAHGIQAVVIATQDQAHTEPAVAAMELGLAVLLEKPMAVTRHECETITRCAHETGVIFAVCHVLRYMPVYTTAARLLREGVIGKIKMLDHTEPVGYWHWTHSFVRGNWRSEASSTFSLMSKTCHDIDLIRSLVADEVVSATLVAAPSEYADPSNQPREAEGATRCLECPIQDTCEVSAKRVYVDKMLVGKKRRGWPVKIVDPHVKDIEDLGEAAAHLTEELKTSDYGKCAWHVDDHDVLDVQAANIVFRHGALAIMKMVAHTDRLCDRITHIYGLKGEMKIDMGTNTIEVTRFADGPKAWRTIPLDVEDVDFGQCDGHNGADFHCISSFCKAVRSGDASKVLTGPEDSLASHRLVFDLQDSLPAPKKRKRARLDLSP